MRTVKGSSISGCLSLFFSFIALAILLFTFFDFQDPIDPLETGNIEKSKEQ
jgi:hypothetical protein